MTTLVALAVLNYFFRNGEHTLFDVKVGFDGYLPVLGGQETTAQMNMTVDVVGLGLPPGSNPRATSEIKALKLEFAGAVMPFGPANVSDYFPKTTSEFTVLGKLIKTDAPNTRLPVHLPGLDVKRFPDITYLPIEFPASGIAQGKAFKFVKPFGDGPVEYEVTPTAITADTVSLSLTLHQSYVNFEDVRKHPTDEATAVYKVTTELKGTGTATFDLKRQLVSQLKIVANSDGEAVDLKTNEKSERKLKTTLTVVAK